MHDSMSFGFELLDLNLYYEFMYTKSCVRKFEQESTRCLFGHMPIM